MFGFGGLSEVVFILFLAMLIFGPEKLPEISRMLAKGMAEVRKASNELKRTLNAELAISEQEKEARRLQTTAPFPPTPTAPAWSGGQTVPNLDAPGASTAAPAASSAAAPEVAAPAAPADIGQPAEADESSEAAYLAAWPEDGSSAAAGSPAPATSAAATSLAPAAADLAAPAKHPDSAAPVAAPGSAPAAAPASPADAGAPADAPAAADAASLPVLAPALQETHGAGSGRDSA